jgi:hypothetical protein
MAAIVLWTMLNVGGIFDRRRWVLASELVRLPVTAAMLGATSVGGSSVAPRYLGLALAVVSLTIWLLHYRRELDGAPQTASRVIAPDLRSHGGALAKSGASVGDP